jgi:hypothetical protein
MQAWGGGFKPDERMPPPVYYNNTQILVLKVASDKSAVTRHDILYGDTLWNIPIHLRRTIFMGSSRFTNMAMTQDFEVSLDNFQVLVICSPDFAKAVGIRSGSVAGNTLISFVSNLPRKEDTNFSFQVKTNSMPLTT